MSARCGVLIEVLNAINAAGVILVGCAFRPGSPIFICAAKSNQGAVVTKSKTPGCLRAVVPCNLTN